MDKARSRAQGSAGLGLAIAREIIRLHGGDIEVVSTQAKGSRFQIRMPRWAAGQETR